MKETISDGDFVFVKDSDIDEIRFEIVSNDLERVSVSATMIDHEADFWDRIADSLHNLAEYIRENYETETSMFGDDDD